VLARGLNVMDSTAISLCKENSLPILVFNMLDAGQHPAGGLRRADRHARVAPEGLARPTSIG
jgi:uridylate kinase